MRGTDQGVKGRASPPAKDMRWISTGEFRMGSDDFYPEEGPVTQVALDGFWIDERPVTVTEFRRFVKATGHVTVAERPLDASLYAEADPDFLVPGALVFHQTAGPVDLDDYTNWWTYVPGANWRHPEGQGSTLDGRDRHPVTQVAFEDAEPMRAGPARSCQPRRSGSTPPEAVWTVPCSPGAMSSCRKGR